jgi:hypothetical protein
MGLVKVSIRRSRWFFKEQNDVVVVVAVALVVAVAVAAVALVTLTVLAIISKVNDVFKEKFRILFTFQIWPFKKESIFLHIFVFCKCKAMVNLEILR